MAKELTLQVTFKPTKVNGAPETYAIDHVTSYGFDREGGHYYIVANGERIYVNMDEVVCMGPYPILFRDVLED